MPLQPYSEAVPSTGGRLHPLVPEEDRLGEKGRAFFNVKKDQYYGFNFTSHFYYTKYFKKYQTTPTVGTTAIIQYSKYTSNI